MQRECKHHGLTDHAPRSNRAEKWRCRLCSSEAVSKRRRIVKTTLIKEAGGCCASCGYDRCEAALQFHHRDPNAKDFRIGDGATKSLDRMRAEASKCDLLCANCHAERHWLDSSRKR